MAAKHILMGFCALYALARGIGTVLYYLSGAGQLQDERITRVAHPRRSFQNAHDQIPAHAGHDDGLCRIPRDILQAVGQKKLHPIRDAEARGVFARLLQRLLAQVGCRDERTDLILEQVHGKIAVIRADVGRARAGRHHGRAQQQPVGDGYFHAFTQKGGPQAALSFRLFTWPFRLPRLLR